MSEPAGPEVSGRTGASPAGVPLFRDRRIQRLLVCGGSSGWLGAIRGSIPAADCRAVLPVLGAEDAAAELRTGIAQALVLVEVKAGRVAAPVLGGVLQGLPVDSAVIAVGDAGLWPWRLVLVEAGYARVFTGLAELDSLLRLARRFFSGQMTDPLGWEQRVQRSLPWPGHASPSGEAGLPPSARPPGESIFPSHPPEPR